MSERRETNKSRLLVLISDGEFPRDSPCIVGPGVGRNGYARVRVDGRVVLAHRWLYIVRYGDPPAGYEIDHLCRVRACVNLGHLEAVTKHVNNLRSDSWAGINARKTHCPNGHEYTPENTNRNRQTGRQCRTCQNAYYVRYAALHREKKRTYDRARRHQLGDDEFEYRMLAPEPRQGVLV